MSPAPGTGATLLSHIWMREAGGEGGLITGTNPVVFTVSDPLRLWIIQVVIIIVTSQLLSFVLCRLRQPKVASEVLGGIILGPTALGRIPGFTENIFPPVSLPYLSLVADIGLCLFLFLVGLEIDTRLIKRNAPMSAIVSLAGIGIPFGLGSILSFPLYHHFINPSIPFTHFMLFIGVTYSITAFPVLCRILTDLKLLDTHIGIVALSASVGNDAVSWVLLALSVALVNAGSGLSAVYILLFVVCWLARKTGSVENGPTTLFMTVVMVLVWACAFFTDSIGANAIFGAFVAGLIIPREGGLAIALTEKLEDIVSIIFLPLYFTFSGLNTNLGLLNNATTWGFAIANIALSFSGKFSGCMIASRVAGYGWRESSVIGALMSCKGSIELIALNVGLQAGILSQQVFSMFVLEALVLTLTTMPLVSVLYPPECRTRVGDAMPSEQGNERAQHDDKVSGISEERPWRHRFTVVLDNVDHLPSAMALTRLILPPHSVPSDSTSTTTKTTETMDKHGKFPDVNIDALQLVELSDRTSAMMRSSTSDSLDPVLSVFRMFAELDELTVSTSRTVVPYGDFAQSVAEHAQKHASHLVLLPWLLLAEGAPPVSDILDGSGAKDGEANMTPKIVKSNDSPFDFIFGFGSRADQPSALHSHFVQGVFTQSKTDVAVYVTVSDRPLLAARTSRLKASAFIFLPFFGGPDDRLALDFVVQLCLNSRMTATVVRMVKHDSMAHEGDRSSIRLSMGSRPRDDGLDVHPSIEHQVPSHVEGHPATLTVSSGTIYSQLTTPTRLQSDVADDVIWSKYATPAPDAPGTLRQALARIQFSDTHTPAPVHAAVQRAREIRETWPRLLVVTGRSKRLAKGSHHAEMRQLVETHRSGAEFEEMRRTIGDVGTAMVVGGSASAVVVVQAANV